MARRARMMSDEELDLVAEQNYNELSAEQAYQDFERERREARRNGRDDSEYVLDELLNMIEG